MIKVIVKIVKHPLSWVVVVMLAAYAMLTYKPWTMVGGVLVLDEDVSGQSAAAHQPTTSPMVCKAETVGLTIPNVRCMRDGELDGQFMCRPIPGNEVKFDWLCSKLPDDKDASISLRHGAHKSTDLVIRYVHDEKFRLVPTTNDPHEHHLSRL